MVHSIRITEQAESKVRRLADLTGGSKTYSDGTSPAPIIDAFRLLIDNAIDGKSISSYQKYCSIYMFYIVLIDSKIDIYQLTNKYLFG